MTEYTVTRLRFRLFAGSAKEPDLENEVNRLLENLEPMQLVDVRIGGTVDDSVVAVIYKERVTRQLR